MISLLMVSRVTARNAAKQLPGDRQGDRARRIRKFLSEHVNGLYPPKRKGEASESSKESSALHADSRAVRRHDALLYRYLATRVLTFMEVEDSKARVLIQRAVEKLWESHPSNRARLRTELHSKLQRLGIQSATFYRAMKEAKEAYREHIMKKES